MSTTEFYFRCKSNPKAPLLTLRTQWEAKEMQNHPDYERVDECGEPIPIPDELDGTIPFSGALGRK